MASPKPANDPDPYVTEERLCLIEDGCKVDRQQAERLHRKRLDEVAKRWTVVEMFDAR